jgi:single-strand DNA-binding protein
MVNHIVIVGNVVKDPDLRTTTNGSNVANFSVATNRRWKKADGTKGENTEFHDVVAWAFLADIASRIQKGERVYVEGHIQSRSWEGADGTKHYRKEIIAENVILMSGKTQEPVEEVEEAA